MNVKDLAKKYNLKGVDFWELPQRKGTWIITHDACERIATIEDIRFIEPDVYTNDGDVAMVGKATMVIKNTSEPDDINEIWTTGEASENNVKGKGRYHWAMAEKRLKDRLTLKLIGAYEYGIYSEVEADSFKNKDNGDTVTMTTADSTFFTNALTELIDPKLVSSLNQWMKKPHTQREIDAERDSIQIILDENA